MTGGADSIDDMDLLRHGAMDVLFGGIRAPSTLGAHLRSYSWERPPAGGGEPAAAGGAGPAGAAAARQGRAGVHRHRLDQKRVYGHKKQGARFGHTKIQDTLLVRGLNALAAVVSTPLSAPVIAAARLRGGNAASARGAAGLRCRGHRHGTGSRMHRHDRGPDGLGVLRGQGDRLDPPRGRAVLGDGLDGPQGQGRDRRHPGDAWTPIKYPRAIWDDQLRAWISDAGVAEVTYTAFTSKKGQAVTARLIVRRVRDQNKQAAAGQDELFPVFRYHAVFTDSPFELLQAEGQHRDHAIVEQVFADITSGPLAHLPSGSFAANAAWLTCAAIACNLLRAAAALASLAYAKARGATLRRDLIDVAARTAHPAAAHGAPPPARGLAPRTRVDDPVRRGLRPARPGGLTSPDPVTASLRPQRPPEPDPKPGTPGQAAEDASGRKPTPYSRPRSNQPAAHSADSPSKLGTWIEAKNFSLAGMRCPSVGSQVENTQDRSLRHGHGHAGPAIDCLRHPSVPSSASSSSSSSSTSKPTSTPSIESTTGLESPVSPTHGEVAQSMAPAPTGRTGNSGDSGQCIQVSWLGNTIPPGDIVTITSVTIQLPFTFDPAVTYHADMFLRVLIIGTVPPMTTVAGNSVMSA